jgi:hypothetical protein
LNKSIVMVVAGISAAGTAFATGYGLKPGLWEMRVVKQLVDGVDRTAQFTSMSTQQKEMMSGMSPEQRERMETMIKQHAGSSYAHSGDLKICISPEEARLDRPIVDRQSGCQPTAIKHEGNRTSYEIQCKSGGSVTDGKGVSTAAGDLITSQVDMTTKMGSGQKHVVHNETEMKFLGASCGDVKPYRPPNAAP